MLLDRRKVTLKRFHVNAVRVCRPAYAYSTGGMQLPAECVESPADQHGTCRMTENVPRYAAQGPPDSPQSPATDRDDIRLHGL